MESDPMDLSSYSSPVISLETVFYHCCAIDHQILVEVSTDGGSTWPYAFDLSESYDRNEAPSNPSTFSFNLADAIMANPSNVSIRFTWPDTGPDANNQVSGVYNWYIDDVVIQEANKNDLRLEEQLTYVPDSSEYLDDDIPIEYTMIPGCRFPCMNFGGRICNIGTNDLSDVQLQVSVTDTNSGNTLYQGTSSSYSLNSGTCIGGELPGYRPPDPDTVWTTDCHWQSQNGFFRIDYRALMGDSLDCDTIDNLGSREFKVTDNLYGLDRYDLTDSITDRIEAPDGGGGYYEEFTCYNTLEFSWMNSSTDTVKEICFYVDDSTGVGAGPIEAGISEAGNHDRLYGKSQPYYVTSSDIGEWVCLEIELDSNGNAIDHLPVPIGDGTIKSAFVRYNGGSEPFAVSTSGRAKYYHSLIEGDFGGSGVSVYLSSEIPMLRAKMNRKQDTAVVNACQSYTVPSGNATYSSSGYYKDTLPGFAGCDSIFTIDLRVDSNSSSTISANTCDNYVVPSGDTSYTASGTYEDTLTKVSGCDSVITINLDIDSSTSSNIVTSDCQSYTVPSGDTTYTSSGTYTDVVTNSVGCDSIITIDLSIDTNSAYMQVDECYSYTVPSGNETYTSSGTYYDTLTNSAGCDSIITIDLSIDTNSAYITPTACDSYTLPSGSATYDSSGVYSDTLTNSAGCDSILTIDLTIGDPDTSVDQNEDTLTAITGGLSYQWLDCDDNFDVIIGENGQEFIPGSNGSYAVEVTDNGCADTSSCYEVTNIGIVENEFGEEFSVRPNPTSGSFEVKLGKEYGEVESILRDARGRLLSKRSHGRVEQFNRKLEGPEGIYFLEVRIEKGTKARVRIIKE